MKERGENKKWIPVMLGIAAAGVYHFVQGNGIFNKMRFASQHSAAERYIQTHFPGAKYSPIRAAGNGWITLVTTAQGDKILLSVTKTENGVYVFREEKADY